MPFVRIGSLGDVPPGSVAEATVNGSPYAVCNAAGEVHVLGGVCPHRGGPVGQGALHETTLVCPWHAWEFDCLTGRNDFDPDVKLQKFAVRIEGDNILADLP